MTKPKLKRGRAAILIGAFLAMITAPVLIFGMATGGGGAGVPADFQEALQGQPSLIIFHSQTCPVCEQDKPHLQELYRQVGQEIQFLYVDVGGDSKDRAIARAYQVRGVPTYVFADETGAETNRVVGTITQVLKENE